MTDQNSAEYLRGPSADLWNSLCVVLLSSSVYCELQMPLSPHILSNEALLYSATSLHWSLKTLKTVYEAIGGLTLFISWLSKITVLGCLIPTVFFFLIWKPPFMYFFPFCLLGFLGVFLVISSKRVDSIPGTSSCPEAKVYTVHLKFFVFMN